MEKLKKLDMKLLTVGGLLIFFLIIWFATFPKVDIYKQATPEDLDKAAAEDAQAYVKDVDNFNSAILFDTKEFCDQIKNSSMKQGCVKMVPDYNAINEGASSNYSSIDVDNFNMMLLTKDKSYCSKISNQALMQECSSR